MNFFLDENFPVTASYLLAPHGKTANEVVVKCEVWSRSALKKLNGSNEIRQ